MRETPYDLERFHNLIDKGSRNIMIWAPRQSGKSYALMMKFLMTRNSVMFTMNNGHERYLRQVCYDLGAPDRRVDLHRIQRAAYATHARTVDAIFIDEIDFMSPDALREAMTACYPCLHPDGRMVAMSTPNRPRNDSFYQRYFQEEFTVNQEGVINLRMESLPSIILNVNDHFGENEQECFRI